MMWATQISTDQVFVRTFVTTILSAIDEFNIIHEVPHF